MRYGVRGAVFVCSCWVRVRVVGFCHCARACFAGLFQPCSVCMSVGPLRPPCVAATPGAVNGVSAALWHPSLRSCTVAILAQGTIWAVAVTQAFFMCGGGRLQCYDGGCCLRLGAAGSSGRSAARTPVCLAILGVAMRLHDVFCSGSLVRWFNRSLWFS